MTTRLFLDHFEPTAVMAVGSCSAGLIAAILFGQLLLFKNYRLILGLLSLSMALASLSLVFSVLQFSDESGLAGRAAVVSGLSSYLTATSSMVYLYRPEFSRRTLLVVSALFLSGFLLFPEAMAARNWNNVSQFAVAIAAAIVVFKSSDRLAPRLRWACIALCLFNALGMTPRLIQIFSTLSDPVTFNAMIDTPAYRLRALIWSVSPVLVYAAVTGVIHARVAQRLRESSDLDILTGAHSRRYLMETGETLLNKEGLDRRRPPTVLLIDVDNFKKFNDTWGHALGDQVLKHCVQCIRNVARVTDAIVGRYGGEEFCVLLPGIEPSSAQVLAERIRREIANNPYRHGEKIISVTVSIGVAQHRERGSLNALIDLADERLYRAKHSGRNRVIDQGELLLPV